MTAVPGDIAELWLGGGDRRVMLGQHWRASPGGQLESTWCLKCKEVGLALEKRLFSCRPPGVIRQTAGSAAGKKLGWFDERENKIAAPITGRSR